MIIEKEYLHQQLHLFTQDLSKLDLYGIQTMQKIMIDNPVLLNHLSNLKIIFGLNVYHMYIYILHIAENREAIESMVEGILPDGPIKIKKEDINNAIITLNDKKEPYVLNKLEEIYGIELLKKVAGVIYAEGNLLEQFETKGKLTTVPIMSLFLDFLYNIIQDTTIEKRQTQKES
jgi:hypothetical protein